MTATPDGARWERRGARFLTLTAVLGGSAVCVLLLVLFVQHRRQPQASGPPTVPTSRPGFPAPPVGAVVYSRQLGSDGLALAVVPQEKEVLVQASVLGPTGEGVSGLDVSAAVQGASRTASSCGAGCYRATLPTAGRPKSVELTVHGDPATRWRVALPTAWPPPDAQKLITRAGRVWRSLHSLTYTDRIASDEQHAVRSTWRVEEPGQVAYQVQGGWAGVIVGNRRWDRPPGGRWVESAQPPVHQPVPVWVSATDAHVLGTEVMRGRPVWRVSFFDPGTPAWFDVALDRETLRTLELRMVTTAHFMHEVFSGFNATPAIRAPR
jgi:hypothetical protein